MRTRNILGLAALLAASSTPLIPATTAAAQNMSTFVFASVEPLSSVASPMPADGSGWWYECNGTRHDFIIGDLPLVVHPSIDADTPLPTLTDSAICPADTFDEAQFDGTSYPVGYAAVGGYVRIPSGQAERDLRAMAAGVFQQVDPAYLDTHMVDDDLGIYLANTVTSVIGMPYLAPEMSVSDAVHFVRAEILDRWGGIDGAACDVAQPAEYTRYNLDIPSVLAAGLDATDLGAPWMLAPSDGFTLAADLIDRSRASGLTTSVTDGGDAQALPYVVGERTVLDGAPYGSPHTPSAVVTPEPAVWTPATGGYPTWIWATEGLINAQPGFWALTRCHSALDGTELVGVTVPTTTTTIAPTTTSAPSPSPSTTPADVAAPNTPPATSVATTVAERDDGAGVGVGAWLFGALTVAAVIAAVVARRNRAI